MENKEQNTAEVSAQNAKPKNKFKFWDSWFGLYVITFILIFVGQLIGSFCTVICTVAGVMIPKFAPFLQMYGMYIMFAGIWIVFLLWFFLIKRNRPLMVTFMPKLRGNNWKGLLIGLIVGGGQNTLCIMSAYIHGDIELHFSQFNIIYLLLLFFAVFVQSSAEELSCRAYLFYKLQNRYNIPAVSIFVSSMFFGLFHLGNEGITILSFINIVAVGVFYAMIVYYTDSLWCVFAAHASWNFTQNIIFGLPNSGLPSSYSIISMNMDTAKNSFFYNIAFGVEGTYFADIVLIASCIILFLFKKKIASKEKYDIWTGSYVPNEVLTDKNK